MIKPTLIELDPNSFDLDKIQLGDEVSLTLENGEGDIPARVVKFNKTVVMVCTDYYELACGDCENTTCLFNLNNRKEG